MGGKIREEARGPKGLCQKYLGAGRDDQIATGQDRDAESRLGALDHRSINGVHCCLAQRQHHLSHFDYMEYGIGTQCCALAILLFDCNAKARTGGFLFTKISLRYPKKITRMI